MQKIQFPFDLPNSHKMIAVKSESAQNQRPVYRDREGRSKSPRVESRAQNSSSHPMDQQSSTIHSRGRDAPSLHLKRHGLERRLINPPVKFDPTSDRHRSLMIHLLFQSLARLRNLEVVGLGRDRTDPGKLLKSDPKMMNLMLPMPTSLCNSRFQGAIPDFRQLRIRLTTRQPVHASSPPKWKADFARYKVLRNRQTRPS